MKSYRPNAYEMKYIVCRYFLYERGFEYAFTEWKNNGDVIALSRSLYPTEVEIKVSLSDLNSEFSAIREAQDTGFGSKARKHKAYLVDEDTYIKRPKFYYICVPDYLEEAAVAGLDGTPYGLLIARFQEGSRNQEYDQWWRIEETIKPGKLSSEKLDPIELTDVLKKANNELLNYRRKISMVAGETRVELTKKEAKK